MVGIIMDTADASNISVGGKTTTQWPSFQVTPPDPVLGKKEMSPEQTLIEFISTSAAFHGVKKQQLQTLEGDLLKVFLNNTMPANAAAWYMAKRKFYLTQPLDQQLLPFLLKKYPHKFTIKRNQVFFLEKYSKETAKKKQQYLVQYGINAYFSHKADEYGVYFFDPQYYENTEPFHESLRQTTGKFTAHRSKLIPEYFKAYTHQFKFTQHSPYLVSISKQPGVKVLTNTTGVIVSMVNNQYGFIKFGSSEKALFCAKSLFKDGWLYTGDPLRLPAMQFDGYQIPGYGSSDQYSWYAVLVWCGRKPSPKYCSTTTDLNSTSLFRPSGDDSTEVISQGKKLRQPSSSMMIGQVIEIRKNAAIVSVRDDSEEKVYVPGWKHEYHSQRKGVRLTTLTGEIVGIGDLVAYYVDTNATKDGYHAVGKNVMVLKEYKDVESKKGRRRRSSTVVSGDSADYEPRRRTRDDSDDSDEDSELDVTDSELEWLERDIESIIDTEPPEAKTLKLLAEVKSALVGARELTGSKSSLVTRKTPSPAPDSGVDSRVVTPAPNGEYQPLSDQEKAFWRLKAALASLDEYDSEDDDDYRPGMDIHQVQEVEHVHNSSLLSDSSGFLAHDGLKEKRRNRLSSMTSVLTCNGDQKYVPYWARSIRQPEVWCPHANKFLVLDIGYREEMDPDYVVPVTDDEEIDSDEGEEDTEALKQEANEEIAQDLLDGRHRIITKVPKIVVTPDKEEKEGTDGEKNPEAENKVEAEVVRETTSDDKTDCEDADAKKAKTGSIDKLWVREMGMCEQAEDYDSDIDQEWIPPAVIYDTDCDYDEVEEIDAVITDEEFKGLLGEGVTEDGKEWRHPLEPGDSTLPPLLCGCQPDKPEEPEQAEKRPMVTLASDSTGLTPALKKLKVSTDPGETPALKKLKVSTDPGENTGLTPALKKLKVSTDPGENIKNVKLDDHENNKPDVKEPDMFKEMVKGSEAPKPKRDSPKKKSKVKMTEKIEGTVRTESPPKKEKLKEIISPPKAEKTKEAKNSPKNEKSKEMKSPPKTENPEDKAQKSGEKNAKVNGDGSKKSEFGEGKKSDSNGEDEKVGGKLETGKKKTASAEKKKKVFK